MILTCPSCSTRYYADDTAIGPSGRSVRCAGCGHTWFAEPQLVLKTGDGADPPARKPLTREHVERLRRQAAAPGPAPSAAARFRQQQAERMRRERMRAAAVAWGATGAAIAATASGAVLFREDVAQLWPNSASAFSALGLDVNVYGLEIYDLTVERDFDGPTPVVVVSGEVRNIGGEPKPAPPLRLVLRNEQAQPVFEAVHALPLGDIPPGEAAAFSIRLDNPPLNAVDLEASFASPAEAANPVSFSAPGEPAATAPDETDPALDLTPGMEAPDGAPAESHGAIEDEGLEEPRPHAATGDTQAVSPRLRDDGLAGRLG